MFKRLIASFVCFAFIVSNYQPVYAQEFSVSQLPVPGSMVGLSKALSPITLKGIVVNTKNPLEFQFIVDAGSENPKGTALNQEIIKEEAHKLVKYFLAGLTIPDGDLWVNLSPYEKDRIVPQALGQTDLGRDLLAQDYILKQLTASLIYPEKDLGKTFWAKVYAKAKNQLGTSNIPINTFNKVWILPDKAQVFENGPAAYVTQSTLKVMLDEDYTALNKGKSAQIAGNTNGSNTFASQIIKEIVLPEIEKEVNTGKNFAQLRQIYQAMILAKWYKETIQNSLLDSVYTNKSKTVGVNLNDPVVKEQIYQRYLQAYKKGVFNYIKEDPTPSGVVELRKYFSGGVSDFGKVYVNRNGLQVDVRSDGAMIALTVAIVAAGAVLGYGVYRTIKSKQARDSIENLSYEELENLLFSPISLSKEDSVIKRLVSIGDSRAMDILVKRLKQIEKEITKDRDSGFYVERFNKLSRILYDFKRVEGRYIYIDKGFYEEVIEETGEFTSYSADNSHIWNKTGEVVVQKWRYNWSKINRDEAMLGQSSAFVTMAAVKAAIEMKPDSHGLDFISQHPVLSVGVGVVATLKLYYHIWRNFTVKGNLFKFRSASTDEDKLRALDFIKSIKRPDVVDELLSILVRSDQRGDSQKVKEKLLEVIGVLATVNRGNIDEYVRLIKEQYYLSQELQSLILRVVYEPRIYETLREKIQGYLVKSDRWEWHSLDAGIFSVYAQSADPLRSEILKRLLFTVSESERNIVIPYLKQYGLGDYVDITLPFIERAISAISYKLAKKDIRRTLTGDNRLKVTSAALETAVDLLRRDGDFEVVYVPKVSHLETRVSEYSGGYQSDGHDPYAGTSYEAEVVDSEERLEIVPIDRALVSNGGIDLNKINVHRTGKVINVNFDPEQLNQIMQGGFEGFTPIITDFKFIQSPFPLLGVNINESNKQLAKM